MNRRAAISLMVLVLGGSALAPVIAGQNRPRLRRPVEPADARPRLIRGDVRNRDGAVPRRAMGRFLSHSEKLEAVKDMGLRDVRPRQAVRLGPDRTYMLDGGSLNFHSASEVNAAGGYARLEPQRTWRSAVNDRKGMWISLKAEAGKRYLIDISTAGGEFWVKVGGSQMTFANTENLTLGYEAPPQQQHPWVVIDVAGTEGVNSNGQDRAWTFYGVEITPLD